MSRAKTA